jgi:hypothetical protein
VTLSIGYMVPMSATTISAKIASTLKLSAHAVHPHPVSMVAPVQNLNDPLLALGMWQAEDDQVFDPRHCLSDRQQSRRDGPRCFVPERTGHWPESFDPVRVGCRS